MPQIFHYLTLPLSVRVAAGNYTFASEVVMIVKKTVAAATTVTLLDGTKTLNGDVRIVKDGTGDAATNNITVDGFGDQTIDGAANYVISENYGIAWFQWNGTQWNVISTSNTLSSTEAGFLNSVTAGTAAASKAEVLDANSELNGIGVIKKADVLIPTAEVLALSATPKTIVAAPGANLYHEFLGAYIFLDYNSAAYASDAGEDLVFKWTNAAGAAVSHSIDGTVFHATADTLAYARPANPAADTVVAVANAAIVLHLLVGEWLTGNSPLKVRCYYRTVRKAALEAIA